jgi:hypothetical protein
LTEIPRIHVADRLLEIHDGPFLELGLKGIVGQVIEMRRWRVGVPRQMHQSASGTPGVVFQGLPFARRTRLLAEKSLANCCQQTTLLGVL